MVTLCSIKVRPKSGQSWLAKRDCLTELAPNFSQKPCHATLLSLCLSHVKKYKRRQNEEMQERKSGGNRKRKGDATIAITLLFFMVMKTKKEGKKRKKEELLLIYTP